MKNTNLSAHALLAGFTASAGLALLSLNAFASTGLKCGDRVVEDLGEISVQTVMAISESGKFLLSDGTWYWNDFLKPAVSKDTHEGIKVGDSVMEFSSGKTGRRFQRVQQIINDGIFQLEDGKWYSSYYITPTVKNYKGLTVGQEVIELMGTETSQTIQHISSNGVLLLSDGEIYFENEVEGISEVPFSGAFTAGQLVTPKYDDQFSVQKIARVSSSGLIELSNHSWYREYEISPLVASYENFTVGEAVIDYKDDSKIHTITHISSYGVLRLSSGNWRYAGYLEKVRCLPSATNQNCSSR